MVKTKINHLEEIFSTSLGKIEILEEHISLLTAPGEHYGSIMLAVDLKIKNSSGNIENLNLVAKCIPVNKILQKVFDISVTFKKEVFAYTETIPTLIKFQKKFNVPDDKLLNIFPKCYCARITLDENKNEVDEDAVLIFENLKLQGYKTEDRLVGFDFDGAKIVLEDLAKFHAVPIALKILEPEVFKEKVGPCLVQNKGLEQLPEEVGLAFHNSIMNTAIKIDKIKPYLSKLHEIVDYAATHPFVYRPPPNEDYGTMTHADYWTSNTMLLCDSNNKPIKNKMIDLQLMAYTSCIRDIVFFLFTSVINEVLDQRFDELIQIYYQSFTDSLKYFNINMEPYSWEGFNKELNEVAPTEIYHVLVMLKPICTEKDKVQNSLEDFKETDWTREDLLGPNHSRKLEDTVLSLAKRGWI